MKMKYLKLITKNYNYNLFFLKLKHLLISLECEILVQLTKTQVELQHWRFLSTLMALYGAQTRMSAWERTLQSKEVSILK